MIVFVANPVDKRKVLAATEPDITLLIVSVVDVIEAFTDATIAIANSYMNYALLRRNISD
jgi:hypothetical protein